jgi:hypothetical protein
MKLIQSEKNYFYKLYKNGKKKRISFEIYRKVESENQNKN